MKGSQVAPYSEETYLTPDFPKSSDTERIYFFFEAHLLASGGAV